MNGLLLTHIDYGVEFDEDQIITEFARKQPRRMELVDIFVTIICSMNYMSVLISELIFLVYKSCYGLYYYLNWWCLLHI